MLDTLQCLGQLRVKNCFPLHKTFFIYLAALGLTYGVWHDLVLPGIEPRPPALGVCSLGHWTTREVAFF